MFGWRRRMRTTSALSTQAGSSFIVHLPPHRVGLELSVCDSGVFVSRVPRGDGLQDHICAGDIVSHVNGRDVRALSHAAIVALIRRSVGSRSRSITFTRGMDVSHA